jgi:CHAD domain-containing protein
MAKAAYNYPPEATLRDAARSVLLAAFCQMMANAEGTRAGLEKRNPTIEDIEFLHDMRVGSRRLRAALAVFGKVFSEQDFRNWDKAVGEITDALGAVRDLDVQIEEFRALQTRLPENEAYGVERLIESRLKERDRQRKKLITTLDKMEKDRFGKRFAKALDRATLDPEQIGKASQTLKSQVSNKGEQIRG